MTLLIDAGNSAIKLRAWQAGNAGPILPLEQAEELLQAARGDAAIISCVARDEVREQLQQRLQAQQITPHWLRSPAAGLGLKNSYAEPARLGVDRFLALAAAYAACGQACCVIDAGTAITLDLCDAQGQHLGGLIAPGLSALQQALRQDTQLPWIESASGTHQAFARNTEQALQQGVLHSACGLIERCSRLAREQGSQQVWLTGGSAPLLLTQLQGHYQHAAALVFEGLALYAASMRW